MSGLLDPQIPQIALFLLLEIKDSLELLTKFYGQHIVLCVINDVGPGLRCPLSATTCIILVLVTRRFILVGLFLPVAPNYVASNK